MESDSEREQNAQRINLVSCRVFVILYIYILGGSSRLSFSNAVLRVTYKITVIFGICTPPDVKAGGEKKQNKPPTIHMIEKYTGNYSDKFIK